MNNNGKEGRKNSSATSDESNVSLATDISQNEFDAQSQGRNSNDANVNLQANQTSPSTNLRVTKETIATLNDDVQSLSGDQQRGVTAKPEFKINSPESTNRGIVSSRFIKRSNNQTHESLSDANGDAEIKNVSTTASPVDSQEGQAVVNRPQVEWKPSIPRESLEEGPRAPHRMNVATWALGSDIKDVHNAINFVDQILLTKQHQQEIGQNPTAIDRIILIVDEESTKVLSEATYTLSNGTQIGCMDLLKRSGVSIASTDQVMIEAAQACNYARIPRSKCLAQSRKIFSKIKDKSAQKEYLTPLVMHSQGTTSPNKDTGLVLSAENAVVVLDPDMVLHPKYVRQDLTEYMRHKAPVSGSVSVGFKDPSANYFGAEEQYKNFSHARNINLGSRGLLRDGQLVEMPVPSLPELLHVSEFLDEQRSRTSMFDDGSNAPQLSLSTRCAVSMPKTEHLALSIVEFNQKHHHLPAQDFSAQLVRQGFQTAITHANNRREPELEFGPLKAWRTKMVEGGLRYIDNIIFPGDFGVVAMASKSAPDTGALEGFDMAPFEPVYVLPITLDELRAGVPRMALLSRSVSGKDSQFSLMAAECSEAYPAAKPRLEELNRYVSWLNETAVSRWTKRANQEKLPEIGDSMPSMDHAVAATDGTKYDSSTHIRMDKRFADNFNEYQDAIVPIDVFMRSAQYGALRGTISQLVREGIERYMQSMGHELNNRTTRFLGELISNVAMVVMDPSTGLVNLVFRVSYIAVRDVAPFLYPNSPMNGSGFKSAMDGMYITMQLKDSHIIGGFMLFLYATAGSKVGHMIAENVVVPSIKNIPSAVRATAEAAKNTHNMVRNVINQENKGRIMKSSFVYAFQPWAEYVTSKARQIGHAMGIVQQSPSDAPLLSKEEIKQVDPRIVSISLEPPQMEQNATKNQPLKQSRTQQSFASDRPSESSTVARGATDTPLKSILKTTKDKQVTSHRNKAIKQGGVNHVDRFAKNKKNVTIVEEPSIRYF